MPITRVKICGITRPEDAVLAAELGADAIGLNFVGGPRKITPHFAHRILESLPPLVSAVALVNAIAYADSSIGPLGILDIALGIPRLRITHFQLYNVPLSKILDLEEPIECWPVFSIASRESFSNILMATHANELRGIWPSRATAVLLDTASEKLGGTGQTFNWNWIAEARDAGELNGLPPLILAGGLTPDNVANAIRIAKPYAVDVSSGVEVPGKPGIKDPIKLRDFIQAAKAALP